ncbi:MAG: PIG-L family deacetylase, partial [Bacteroidota bacterium]
MLACSPPTDQPAVPDEDPALKTIMAVFAHPDDETTVSPILARLAEEGHSVHLVITTDGRHGVTDHAGIPAGDSLIQVRILEAQCSCDKLGIEPPIFLALHDGLKGTEGMDGIFPQLQEMQEKLLATIERIDPDVVITFGPDGDSGHPDHRLTGA